MMAGKGVLEKSDRTTWHSGWMPHFWKFSKKSFQAFSSRNRTWGRGIVWEEVEELEPWRGFWPEVDLHALSATHDLSEREKEREREREIETQSQPEIGMKGYVCMNMWCAKFKLHHGWNPIETYQHTFINNQTHIYNAWNIVRMQWEWNAWEYSNNFTKPNPKILGKTQKPQKIL